MTHAEIRALISVDAYPVAVVGGVVVVILGGYLFAVGTVK